VAVSQTSKGLQVQHVYSVLGRFLKAFSRTPMKSTRYKTRFPGGVEPEMEKSELVPTRNP